MSATGKSTVVSERTARGYKAVDTDDGWCELRPDGRQMWREEAIQALLAAEDGNVVRRRLRGDWLAARSNNGYGKAPEELRRFPDDVETAARAFTNAP